MKHTKNFETREQRLKQMLNEHKPSTYSEFVSMANKAGWRCVNQYDCIGEKPSKALARFIAKVQSWYA